MGINRVKKTTKFAAAVLALAITALVNVPANADDTEIYQATLSASGSARPKVLIIIDDSGSMDAIAQQGGEKPAYDPNATYADAGFDDSRIYWSTTGSKPAIGTNNYFAASSNRCESSFVPLANEGNTTTKAKRWRPASGSMKAEWLSLSSGDQTPTHVECQADVLGAEAGNGPSVADGFPFQPADPDAADSESYTGTLASSNISWGNTTYNWYTAHYLNWWYDDTILSVEKTRLEVAQEVIKELVNSNPSIDFGLEVFNDNADGVTQYWCSGPTNYIWNGNIYVCPEGSSELDGPNTEGDHGGRIIHAIIEDMTLADRNAMAGSSGLINSITADGWTPLCEATYEAYLYLVGETPVYGTMQDVTTGPAWDGEDSRTDSPNADTRAIDSSTGDYANPNTDCAYSYVILMTDGYPTYDTHANAAIESLTGETCDDYPEDFFDSFGNRVLTKNCLPTITKYMANNDLDSDSSNGTQFGITYTIGFATDQQLLEDAALNGKGQYFTADSTESLTAAFEGAVFSILSSESSFTSPSVAVNTFTRTQSRNEVFFALFKPDATMDWPGNIKRLDIKAVELDDDTVAKKFVDRDEVEAIDESTGLIKGTAKTAWGNGTDGLSVDKGGVGELLAASDLSTRPNRMWTNTGTNGALENFQAANFTPDAYGFDVLFPENPTAALLQFWDVPSEVELFKSLAWGVGHGTEDLDGDNNSTEARDWIMADILHSRPRVISYGALGSFDEDAPDLRILVGTNAGFLHMFGNDDGVEDWAFFPKELGPVLTARRTNSTATGRPYGIDSPPVVYSLDINRDGTLDASDGDKVWAFFGLRRGGRNMYALDISDPDSPSFMWMIDTDTTGFAEIGQTWSVPKVAYIPGYSDLSGNAKPVLIFGAGYDPAKDAHSSLGDDNDTMGRGVYIVDAETGALVWSVTPAANSTTNLQATGLEHSVPGAVATLDSNGDDLVDRIYFGDTAGILWRIDMPGATLPTNSQDTWRLTKVFEAVEGTRTQANDRRFFNQPDIVRIEFNGKPGDAILIGSGDRTNPGAVDYSNDPTQPAVENEFYMINDLAVSPYTTDFNQPLCATDMTDFRCSLPLHPSDLYNATANTLQTLREAAAADGATIQDEVDLATELGVLYGSVGWRITLAREGEKSLSKSVTIQGRVLFTTFTPGVGQANMCEPALGEGRLYAVSLYDATEIPEFDTRYVFIGNQIPGTPAVHVDEEGKITIIPPQGSGGTGDSDLIDTGASMPAPYGSYWYREEY